MSNVQKAIGQRWEDILQEKYPELISTAGDVRVPDFYHPSGFWIEAKSGKIEWGCRIKKYQLDQIADLKDPIVYAFGMHNLEQANKKVNQKTDLGRKRYLERNMAILETYFISGNIVNEIFEKDQKSSEKGLVYCMVKPCSLRNIMRCVVYSNPQEAFDLMNKWTDVQNSYETQFDGRKVTAVEVMFEGVQPRCANIQYMNYGGYSHNCETINLELYGLRDKPRLFHRNHRKENPRNKVMSKKGSYALRRKK